MSLEETNKRIASLEMKLSKAKREKRALKDQSTTLIQHVNKILEIWKKTIRDHEIRHDQADENSYALYIYPPIGNTQDRSSPTLTTCFKTLEEYRAAKCDWDPVIFYARTREALVPDNWETLWLVGMTFFVFKVGTKFSPVESDYKRTLVDVKLYSRVRKPIPIYVRGPEKMMVDFTNPGSLMYAFGVMTSELRGNVAAIPKIKGEIDDKLAEIDRIHKKAELDVLPFV